MSLIDIIGIVIDIINTVYDILIKFIVDLIRKSLRHAQKQLRN